MPLWNATTVVQEPSTMLLDWQVMQFADGGRSFVDYAVESREGRVSSPVAAFDVRTLRGVTASGRVYQLQGRPGVNPDAAYLWSRYVSGHEAETSDVTAYVWSEHVKAVTAETPVTSIGGRLGADHA